MDARAQLIARLRADLTAADFTVAHLATLWGEDAAAALIRGHRVPARRALDRLGESDPAGTLARVFVLGMPVAAADLDRALPTLRADGALELELVLGVEQPQVLGVEQPPRSAASSRPHPRTIPSEFRPLVDLCPYSFTDSWGAVDWWIASDLGELALGAPLHEDHVLGVGGASLTLSRLQLERSANVTLDLGTGCGIQAMHASRHSGRVVATDISARALGYARFNALLNGIGNIDFRLGSLFEPVDGERFDRIVSNPPFVITPRVAGVPTYEYRDGGLVGDELVAAVIHGCGAHLEPGGIAQLLGNWEYRGSQDAFERVTEWLDDADLDAWIIEREVQDDALYAQTWIRDGGTRAGVSFDELEDAWLDDFESRDVTQVGFGYMLLRNPVPELVEAAPSTGSGTVSSRWRRLERLDGPVAPGLSAHIDATVSSHDWQAALDDDALARTMLTVAPDVTEERHYWPGDENPAVMNLRQGGGFARTYPLGTALAAVVGACDGELSVGAICAAVAHLLEVDEAELLAEVLPDIRELITVGILRQ
jgi:methylase of polypeptide subunit release factors